MEFDKLLRTSKARALKPSSENAFAICDDLSGPAKNSCTSRRGEPQSQQRVCKSWPISQVQSGPTGAQVGSIHGRHVIPGTTMFRASWKAAAAESSWHRYAAVRYSKNTCIGPMLEMPCVFEKIIWQSQLF